MAVHKLTIGTFDEIDYKLFAIHSAVEDYLLAFLINKNSPLLLSKIRATPVDDTQNTIETHFSRFEFHNADTEVCYNLIQNKTQINSYSPPAATGLFDSVTEMSTTLYLLPELKKVDYFLKVEDDADNAVQMFEKLQKIDQIAAIYEVSLKQIKSKNNLIF